MKFILNSCTRIETDLNTKPIMNAIRILHRDMGKKFIPCDNTKNKILLLSAAGTRAESFLITVEPEQITLTAGDDLGFVFGLLYISEKFMGIQPFWFWMDQPVEKIRTIEIEPGRYESPIPIVKYRGWFLNDEVLIMKWDIGGDPIAPWEMAFEALLRCGGNIVIPGTDKNAKKYAQLASEMGLWITHHHAEPLGAEMFVRAYPDLQPNYGENAALFWKLWEEAVQKQKDYAVVWSLGFRGQGDCPFWSHDSSGQFNTPKKRGKLISELIEKQRQLVLKYVKDPVFCTNLYGEIMELYEEGHIEISEDIIKISADNGYGKMVTRRRDNHCVRISSLPKSSVSHGGIYYHASFYDLQAANHITRLPNSIDFINSELSEVIEKNAVDYWIINSSNIRPHVYSLDAIRKKWYNEEISDEQHSRDFARTYYSDGSGISECLSDYSKAMLAYGKNEDEHAGEQFYTENIRMAVNQFIRDRHASANTLQWLTGEIPLPEQIKYLYSICKNGETHMEQYYNQCRTVSSGLSARTKQLFDATVLLQAAIHYHCMTGVLLFGEAYEKFEQEHYLQAFMGFGYSAEQFDAANTTLKNSEYGVWQGFYFNECFADIKHTAYMICKLMGIVRELGDNARHDKWYREAVYTPEDRNVFTLLVRDNHMTDWELFKAFQRKHESQL